MEQYEHGALLGKGHSWEVFVARDVNTARLYAVKERQKQRIIDFDEVTNLRREMETLQALSETKHPYLIKLVDMFHTQQAIYFVTDFMGGGDLEHLLERTPLHPELTRNHAAELCLAIKYLHERGVVHRNIRLDNILIADDGRIVLGGFGTCRPEMTGHTSRTSSFVGGGEFMPPEVLLDQEYGRAVDWWAFGIVLYQLLLRHAPFSGDSADKIYDAILTEEPDYSKLPIVCAGILRRLLERDPQQRLGSAEAGALEVMQHAYFDGIIWDDVMLKPFEAPRQLIVDVKTVLGNFRDEHAKCADRSQFRQFTSSAKSVDAFHDFGFPG